MREVKKQVHWNAAKQKNQKKSEINSTRNAYRCRDKQVSNKRKSHKNPKS